MLPIILGIGAAALLLGRKVIRRTRRNPRKHRRVSRKHRNPGTLKSYEFSFLKSPRMRRSSRITWRRFGADMEQALRLGKAAAKNDYPEACSFLIMAANPRRRRNPDVFASGAFAAELARQRAASAGKPKPPQWASTGTMPNPKRKGKRNPPYRYLAGAKTTSPTSGIVYKVRYDTGYQEWQVAAFKDGKFAEGPTVYSNDKQDALDTLAAFAKGADLPSKMNPRRKGKRKVRRSRISVSEAAARMMQWRWHHNPSGRDLVPWIVVTTEMRGFSHGKPNIRTEKSAFRGKSHTAKALAAWVLRYNQSFTSGGVNSRASKAFGYEPYAFKAKLINQRNGRVAATYDTPKFQVL
jgi:hypothetical protein